MSKRVSQPSQPVLIALPPGIENTHGNASQASRWLRDHYAEICVRLGGRYPPYEQLAGEMAKLGLTGRNGQAVTGDSLRGIWRRVRQDMDNQQSPAGSERAPERAPERLVTDVHAELNDIIRRLAAIAEHLATREREED